MSHPEYHLRPTDHAKFKWLERTSGAITLTEGIEQAMPVGAPRVSGKALLHDPEGALIVHKEGEVITILNVQDWELGDGHLPTCDDCGYRWDPSQTDECHWCQAN